MTTRTPSDAAPSAIAAPEAKKKRRRACTDRLQCVSRGIERTAGGSDCLKPTTSLEPPGEPPEEPSVF